MTRSYDSLEMNLEVKEAVDEEIINSAYKIKGEDLEESSSSSCSSSEDSEDSDSEETVIEN